MDTYHAAYWSDSPSHKENRNRITHHNRTKRRGDRQQRRKEEWAWDDVLDGKGCYTWEEILAGKDRLPWELVEAARRAEAAGERSRRYEGTRLARKPERQPQTFLGGVAHRKYGEAR